MQKNKIPKRISTKFINYIQFVAIDWGFSLIQFIINSLDAPIPELTLFLIDFLLSKK